MPKRIAVVGTFDTKAAEYKFLIDQLQAIPGYHVVTINTGIMKATDLFRIDVPAAEVVTAGGSDLETLRAAHDRGKAIAGVSKAAAAVLAQAYAQAGFDAIVGMGAT